MIYPLYLSQNGKDVEYKKVEKHHRGFVENEVWSYQSGSFGRKLDDVELEMLGINAIDDFSEIWDDFLVFPTKNSTESDVYFGQSDYKNCKSIVEESMLTISQNSKIINRHANPKLAGSEQNLEHDPVTNERRFPDSDFLKVGSDGVKPEYITADLQADAIDKHVNTLLQFFYILTKTPPQAYGIDLSGTMSGESLRKIFIAALAKVDDIKQVSFNSTIKNVVKCAMAFNLTPVSNVQVAWGEPIPADYSEQVEVENSRVTAGTQSKLTTIMTLDKVSKEDAMVELARIEAEKEGKIPADEDNEENSAESEALEVENDENINNLDENAENIKN